MFLVNSDGSIRVKFRVKVVVVAKTPTDTSKRIKVTVSKTIITEAKTGLVGNLQVDDSPKELQISSEYNHHSYFW